MWFRSRQGFVAALVANAVRPVPGVRAGIPAFFAGWMVGELAPHVLALTTADTVAQLARRGRRADPVGLALAALSSAGLIFLIGQARRAGDVAEDALGDALGEEWTDPRPTGPPVPWRGLVNPFRSRPDGVRVERDIGYADHGRRGRLDVYLPPEDTEPASDRGAPVLVQVHGGAWILGSKETQGVPLMRYLARRGWVCVALNYRLAPRDPWPAQVVDVKRALAWVKEHIAAYGGDPSYVALTGGSAGGHLAALAALTPGDPAFQPGFEDADTSVRCCVPHYGVYDLAGATGLPAARAVRDGFFAPRVAQRRFRDDPDLFEQASPLLRVGRDAPDFFVIHGALDTLVPVFQARRFVERLRAVSRQSVVYAELPGTQHAFDVFPSIRSSHVVRSIERYLHWHRQTWLRGGDHADEVEEARG